MPGCWFKRKPLRVSKTNPSAAARTGMDFQSRATQQLVVDQFGEGCLGGAGRIPTLGSLSTNVAFKRAILAMQRHDERCNYEAYM